MPFIPHTENDVQEMLAAIGAKSVDELFDEIPQPLRSAGLKSVPAGLSEMEITRLMRARAAQDGAALCFAGAGAYEHHIPAAVWELTTRGEFYSAYTPYQAEASQGTLQLLYEFQTMMANLTGMDVSNASLYDGASALAEAVLMAVRANRKSSSKRVLIPATVHPHYRKVVRNIVSNQGIEIIEPAYAPGQGNIRVDALGEYTGKDIAALVIPLPNFFGVLEDVHALTDWAKANNVVVIAQVNPVALALLSAPDEWGTQGADIVCGEGQPLGVPLSSGGPYFGFICCRQEFVRQMPGRIVGRTVDLDGKPGFTLTLQAREQHIRRSKATSNICTNQGLLVTAATIYMSLIGADGLERVAASSHANTQRLLAALTAIEGVTQAFDRAYFHEFVIRVPADVDQLLQQLAAQGIVGGYSLKQEYPELGDALLICATETKTALDIDTYARALRTILKAD